MKTEVRLNNKQIGNDLDKYMVSLNESIRRLNKANARDLKSQKKKALQILPILEKQNLTDTDLSMLNSLISNPFFKSDTLTSDNMSAFSLMANHIIKEKEQSGSVREDAFKLLQSIISKEDFSLYDFDCNIEAFNRLYKMFKTDEIDFLAILNYLTSKDKMLTMVRKSTLNCGFTDVRKRLNDFCYQLEVDHINFYSYQYKKAN